MNVNPPPPPPTPVPPSTSVIRLPKDQYRHIGSPTEWWWHIGTLRAGERVFGFEINAAAFGPLKFTQVMLSDVLNNVHYQQTHPYPFHADDWAEADPTKEWFATLGTPDSSSFVAMKAPQSDPTRNIEVNAALVDATTQKKVKFALKFSQEGPPFIVWGSGVNPTPEVPGGVANNNYYYSFTRVQASGTIQIEEDDPIKVEGVTWMDHEYGLFGSADHPVKWFLQDMQLDNGVCISNYTVFNDGPPVIGTPTPCQATVQFADGTTYFEKGGTLTPIGRTWTSSMGNLFYMEFQIELPAFKASLNVKSLMDDQDFPFPGTPIDTYEGVAAASGTFMGKQVRGTAWNEQQP